MAKKKVTKKTPVIETPKLTPGQYWEWRCTIEEMKTAKLYLQLMEAKKSLIQRDIKILDYEGKLKLQTVNAAKQAEADAKKEYERFKGELESSLGMSFENCVIDDVTYEVKKLD